MTVPTAGSSPSPSQSPQPVPDPATSDTAAALTDPNGTVDSPTLELRQAQITAVNYATATCSVAIGGDSTSVPNVHYLSNYKPTVGDTCWVLVNGPDLLALDRDGIYGAAAFAGLGQSYIATYEGRNSGTYGNLATLGPVVNTTVPASGRLLICCSADIQSPVSTARAFSMMSFDIVQGGTTTFPADDAKALGAITYSAASNPYSTDTFFGFSYSHSHSFSGSGSNTGGVVTISGTTGTEFDGSLGSHNHTLSPPSVSGSTEVIASRVALLTGLTPGAAVVTARYRTSGGAGNWGQREVWVLPL